MDWIVWFQIGLMMVVLGVTWWRVGRHRCTWSNWKDFTSNTAPITQVRRCSKCGKAETRTS